MRMSLDSQPNLYTTNDGADASDGADSVAVSKGLEIDYEILMLEQRLQVLFQPASCLEDCERMIKTMLQDEEIQERLERIPGSSSILEPEATGLRIAKSFAAMFFFANSEHTTNPHVDDRQGKSPLNTEAGTGTNDTKIVSPSNAGATSTVSRSSTKMLQLSYAEVTICRYVAVLAVRNEVRIAQMWHELELDRVDAVEVSVVLKFLKSHRWGLALLGDLSLLYQNDVEWLFSCHGDLKYNFDEFCLEYNVVVRTSD